MRAAIIVTLSLGCFACDPDPDSDAGTDAGGGMPDTGTPVADAGMDAGPDAPDAGAPCEGPPGLYMSGSCTVLDVGVRAYEPRFELWSDAAEKERFIFLPTASTIDTTDPDNWVFPVGTRLYKTFSHDGVRLETRLLEKMEAGTGVGAWRMRVFAWNADQDAVTDVTNEGDAVRLDALDTEHDIPSGAQCVRCHSGSLDVANGFSAIQLAHANGGVTLTTLLEEGALSDPPTPADVDVPGDDAIVEGLGYLHANCGHCHRYTRYLDPEPPTDCTDVSPDCGTCVGQATAPCNTGLHMWLRVQDVTVEDTDTYATAVGRRGGFTSPTDDALCRIHPGQPATSTIMVRMRAPRGEDNAEMFPQMPPLGSEVNHPEGEAALSAFITALTGDATGCVE